MTPTVAEICWVFFLVCMIQGTFVLSYVYRKTLRSFFFRLLSNEKLRKLIGTEERLQQDYEKKQHALTKMRSCLAELLKDEKRLINDWKEERKKTAILERRSGKKKTQEKESNAFRSAGKRNQRRKPPNQA